MEKSDDLRLMVKIAQMYYEQNSTQAEIAQTLGIYRTSISRILKKVREQGIVSISINYNYNDNLLLEQQLKSRFGLREVVVVADELSDSPESALISMAKQCGTLLNRIIEKGDVIGFSWGSAIAALVEQMDSSPMPRQVTCIPLVGGPSGKLESRFHVNTLVYSAALKLKGESLLIDFPAILEKSVIRDAIIQSQHYQTIAELWDRLDIAVFGIGSPNISGNSTWRAFYGGEVIDHFNDRNVAGDICSRFYDIQGNPVETLISDKTITIPLDKIKAARYSIGVAYSHEKISGIIGAIQGKYINCLVTTQATVKEILQMTE